MIVATLLLVLASALSWPDLANSQQQSITATTNASSSRSVSIAATQWEDFSASNFLMSVCRLESNINSPREFENVPANLTISLAIDRFIGIDEVAESFTVTGVITYSWMVPCVAKATKLPGWPPSLDSMPKLADTSNYWMPSFLHRNSLNDLLMKNQFSSYLNILPVYGAFIGVTMGTFYSYCDLELFKFPFDVQTCHIYLTTMYPSQFAIVGAIGYLENITENFMGPNAQWEYLGLQTSHENTLLKPIGLFHGVKYSFTFRRKPQYYLYSLLIPSFVLCILQIAMFLTPPESPARAGYAVTVLMSFFVLQSQIWSVVPHTPRRLLVSFYAVADTIFAMLCVLYAGGMCCALTMHPDLNERLVQMPSCWIINEKPARYRLKYLVDTIAFIAFSVVYIFINAMIFGYALSPD